MPDTAGRTGSLVGLCGLCCPSLAVFSTNWRVCRFATGIRNVLIAMSSFAGITGEFGCSPDSDNPAEHFAFLDKLP
jgi:hypothetical protein